MVTATRQCRLRKVLTTVDEVTRRHTSIAYAESTHGAEERAVSWSQVHGVDVPATPSTIYPTALQGGRTHSDGHVDSDGQRISLLRSG